MSGPIRIATRGSAQATTQATRVAEQLASHGYQSELVLIETFGDRTQADNVPLHTIGGQGVFVKEIQRAVLDGRADLAVHSAKDLPSATTEGLTIGATVATGSVRRRAQLAAVRPDLRFAELRGNIHSRLGKVPEGGAIVIAVAALQVLGLTDVIDEVLDLGAFVPAVGQGCVAVECRSDDAVAIGALAAIDDKATRWGVTVERAFLGELGSGCSLPVGAHVDRHVLNTFLAGTQGRALVSRERHQLTGVLDQDVRIARAAARRALAIVSVVE